MADVTQTNDQELDEFGRYLEAIEAEGDEVVAEAEREVAERRKVKEQVEAKKYVTKAELDAERMIERFEREGSDTAKALFSVYSNRADVSDPEVAKSLIELALTNAAPPKEDGESQSEGDESVEDRAARMAKEDYGAGPLAAGGPAEKPDQDKIDIELIAKGGPEMTKHLTNAIFRDDPVLGQFVD